MMTDWREREFGGMGSWIDKLGSRTLFQCFFSREWVEQLSFVAIFRPFYRATG